MYFWLFRTFAGFLLRLQLMIIARLTFAGVRTAVRGVKAIGRSARPTKRQKSEQEENRRMAGCRQVVLEYADALGFIARESISRDELEKLIDEGIQPDDLAREIQRRIDEKPGIMLGHYHFANGSTPIKLPYSLRDRHMYMIGRSGSGKTNLIRLMALQDIADGNGIGMLAPEQELIIEEILPYIPQPFVFRRGCGHRPLC
jgi:hypothetical protein